METPEMREGYCLNDEFHYVGLEDVVTCPVCGEGVLTHIIGCDCDISIERVEELLREREAAGNS